MLETAKSRSTEALLQRLVDEFAISGVLTPAMIDRAKRAADATGERLDRVLNRLGLLNDEQLVVGYQAVTGLPVVSLKEEIGEIKCPADVGATFLRYARIIPLSLCASVLEVAIDDPLDRRSLDALAFRTGLEIKASIASHAWIEQMLARLPGAETDQTFREAAVPEIENDDISRLRDRASEAPIIRLVHEIIEAAVDHRSTDIHITKSAQAGRIRFRVDGDLEDFRELTPAVYQAVVSRLKIMAALDIGENRVPQDGRIQTVVAGSPLDLRISTMPHLNGEGAFIRLLVHDPRKYQLNQLDIHPIHISVINDIIAYPNGLFLVTGPTGSGKTTTLYAILRELNRPSINIITVEDPIEYRVDGINQIQINRRAGLDFPKVLRSVLRQDPDVILIGEIRDKETASIAVQAALTGHLVLATLHTNDAATVVDRLIDMGIEPFLLGAVLRGAMAQRLTRQLCLICSRIGKSETGKARSLISCEACNGTQFHGRIPIVEIFKSNSDVQSIIAKGGRSSELRNWLNKHSFGTLQQDGARLIREVKTTEIEVVKALGITD